MAYETQHNFFYTERLVHSTSYNYKKIRSFGWTERICFVGRCREKNSQCRM